MCFFKIKTPKITTITQDTSIAPVTAKALVPETASVEPESPLFGGLEDSSLNNLNNNNNNKKKGKSALKVSRGDVGGGYNPLTF